MRHISTSTAERKHILSAMDRHIEVAKAKVKSEEPKSEWTFEQVQEAFKHQVELDRVRHSSRVLSWHPNHASKTLRRLSGGPSVMSEQFLLWKKKFQDTVKSYVGYVKQSAAEVGHLHISERTSTTEAETKVLTCTGAKGGTGLQRGDCCHANH